MTQPPAPPAPADLEALPDDVQQLLDATRSGPALTGAARQQLWRAVAAAAAEPPVSPLERPAYPRRSWLARHRWALAAVAIAALGGGGAVAVVGLRGRAAGPGVVAPTADLPTTGTMIIEVQTAPPGAQVTRGGAILGVTPIDVEVPMNQAVPIHLALPGFEARDVEIPAMRGTRGTFEVGLTPCAAAIDAMTPSCRRAYCEQAHAPSCDRAVGAP